MINFCCFFTTKRKNYNIFAETWFQWLLIGMLSLCEEKQMPKFVKSRITFPPTMGQRPECGNEVFGTLVAQASGARYFIEYFYQIRVKMAESLADASESLIFFFTVLTNTETCINLLNSLEYKRNWTEWAFDWAVGERNSINRDRMFRNLILLKRYVDDVIKVHGEITNALDRVKGLHTRCEQLSLLTIGIADLCVDDKSQIFIMRLNSKFLENTELLPEKFKIMKERLLKV